MSRTRLLVVTLALAFGLIAYWLFRPKAETALPPPGSAAPSANGAARRARGPAMDPEEARRTRAEMRKRILDQLEKRGEKVRPEPPERSARALPKHPKDDGDQQRGQYDPAYIQANFREDMFPLLRSCYEGALKRKPDLQGKLVLAFTIVGDPDVGGVVEDAAIDDTSSLQDEDMETCVRESLMTLTFDKPPRGGGYVSIKYPILFTPGPDQGGDDAGAADGERDGG